MRVKKLKHDKCLLHHGYLKTADPVVLGVSRPHGHGAGFRPPPVSVANIMVKNNAYRPTSELVSMM